MTHKKNKSSSRMDPYAAQEHSNYDAPICSREGLIAILEAQVKPMTWTALVKKLRYQKSYKADALKKRLAAMTRDGQIICKRGGYVVTSEARHLVSGTVRLEKNGYGLLKQSGDLDLLLPPRQTVTLMHGDMVSVRPGAKIIKNKRIAVLVDVESRIYDHVVGQVERSGNQLHLLPRPRTLTKRPIVLHASDPTVKVGDYVTANIVAYPTKLQPAEAKIVKRLGQNAQQQLEIELAISVFDLPHVWASDVLDQIENFDPASAVAVDQDPKRVDLRHLPFVTIDGADAKDFDDAIYATSHKDGGWTLYVAIADVSHYVKRNSPLDHAAYERATSVYFPNHVLPMLPEILSNDLCSLVPLQDRLVMVAKVHVGANGLIQSYDFFRGIIHSHARMTYDQVADMAEGTEKVPGFWRQTWSALQAMYHVLHLARTERGAIAFDSKETEMHFDASGKITAITPSTRTMAHCLIEECMLLANQAVGLFLSAGSSPAVYRIHARPTEEKAFQLQQFLATLSIKTTFDVTCPKAKEYNTLLAACQERQDYGLIQTVMLRSMPQAVYGIDNAGHFGLAYDAYCHFTSPIRRYPDLLVHRILGQYIDQQPVKYTAAQLETMAAHCSMAERRAEECARSVIGRLKCEFMQDKIGQQYKGRVTSVTSFGVFVCLDDVYVEGLVHMRALPKDFYVHDATAHTLRGQKTQRVFRLGDAIHVEVVGVDVEEGYIDFKCI